MHFREHFICRFFFRDVGHEMTFGCNFTGAETEAPAICSVSQQSESAKLVVKAFCAQAVPKGHNSCSLHRKILDLKNNLRTEDSKQEMGSSMKMALKHYPDLLSHRTAGKGLHFEPEAMSDALLIRAQEAVTAYGDPVVTAFTAQIPNLLVGSEPAVSLALSTGQSCTIVVNFFLM